MAEVPHIQYDELPYRRFRLPWYDAAGALMTSASEGWVPLNADDTVWMVLRVDNTDMAVALFITNAAEREVEWRPDTTAEAAVDGSFDFRVTVKTAGGQTYSCPRPSEAPWKLVMKKSTATTDVVAAA